MQQNELTESVIYREIAKFAKGDENKATLTLKDMENYTCHFPEGKTVITSLGEGFTGFPMIGGLKNVNLTSTTSQQAAIEVGMKILYAKINFSISVAEGTENQSTGQGSGIQFNLTGYSVHNTSTATTLAIPANKGTLPTDFLGNTIEGAEGVGSRIFALRDVRNGVRLIALSRED